MSRTSKIWFTMVLVFFLVSKTWSSTSVQNSTEDLYSHLSGHTTRILLPDDTVLDENFWRSILGEDYKRAVHLVLGDRDVHVENDIGPEHSGTAANEESASKSLEKKSIIDGAEEDDRDGVREDTVEYVQKNITMKRESITKNEYSTIEGPRNETKETKEDQGSSRSESLSIETVKNGNKTVSQPNESQKKAEQSHRPSVIDHNEFYMELKEPVHQQPEFSSQIHKYAPDHKHQSKKRHTDLKEQVTDRDNSTSGHASVTVNLLAVEETTVMQDTPIVFKIHSYLKPPANQDQQKHLRAKMNASLSQSSIMYRENKIPENYNQHSNMFNRSFDLSTSTFQSITPRTKEVTKEKTKSQRPIYAEVRKSLPNRTEPSKIKDSNKELFEVGS